MFSTETNSYAKINFGLRILSKRDDGFHNLETIFYPLKLHDKIKITICPSGTKTNSVILKSDKIFIPLTKDNLCYKAIEYFFREFQIADFYKIEISINKTIPIGGGLGGGSSNAAAVLKILMKFFNIDIKTNRKKILDLALRLGSDVPFFLIRRPCYATGRGEVIRILNGFEENFSLLIVNPNLHVSTKWAFEKLNFKKGIVKSPVFDKVEKLEFENLNLLENDFEETVFKKYKELEIIKDELKSFGAVYSSMSGTGATMYGLFQKNKKGTLIKCRDFYSHKKYFTFISY